MCHGSTPFTYRWPPSSLLPTCILRILHWCVVGIGLQWLGFVFAVALFVVSGRNYYKHCEAPSGKFTVFFNIAATLLWISIVRTLLMQTNIQQYSAGLSLSLAAAGALQMLLGMRLPNKTMRLLSIGTFGVIIVKLALYDVWLMPAVGRIVVFIILGALLLVVSFMYQKLKDTLNLSGDDQARNPLKASKNQQTASKKKAPNRVNLLLNRNYLFEVVGIVNNFAIVKNITNKSF